jgi:putative inorganic carbon (HCO3(-)) transporter
MKEQIIEILFHKEVSLDKFIIFLMVAIYPFITIPNSYGYFYFPRFIILLVTALLSLIILFKNYKTIIERRNIYLLMFIIFMLISSVLSYDKQTGIWGLGGMKLINISGEGNNEAFVDTARFTGLVTYISCIFLYLLSCTIKKPEKFIKYMIYACTIVSLIGIMQHFGINIVPHDSFREGFPPYATIGQHNFFATYTVFILPASVYYTLKSGNKYWLIPTSIIYSGLLVSTTRGAWIALFISLIILGMYCFKNRELMKKFIVILISLLIVTCVLLPTKNGLLLKRAESIPQNITSGLQLDDSSGSARMSIWKQTIKLTPQYWSFGIGPDNLIYAGVHLGKTPVDKAHNIYLEMFITMGVFTLISYLLFLSTFLKKRNKELGFMFFLMIFTYLVQGFFNIDVIMVMPLFWIILGFSAANEKNKCCFNCDLSVNN